MSSLSAAARRDLGALLASLGDRRAAEFASAGELADALSAGRARAEPSEPLVVTGLGWRDAAPFVATARAFAAPAVMLVSGTFPGTHPAFEAGAAAVLGIGIPPERLRAALAAVQAGLRVFDTGHGRSCGDRCLTPREYEILGLLADGASNKRIARELGVTPNTVKFHLGSLFAKLAVSSRAEAVGVALRRGELIL